MYWPTQYKYACVQGIGHNTTERLLPACPIVSDSNNLSNKIHKSLFAAVNLPSSHFNLIPNNAFYLIASAFVNLFRMRITIPSKSYFYTSHSTMCWVNILIWLTLSFIMLGISFLLYFLLQLPVFPYRSPMMMVLFSSIFHSIKEYFFEFKRSINVHE